LKLYKQGVGHFKDPKPLRMKPSIDQNDMIAERIAMDIFSSGGGNIAPQPKYDRKMPQMYFIEKYAGGPFSNNEQRKGVSEKILFRAAVKI